MTQPGDRRTAVSMAQALSAELAEYARPSRPSVETRELDQSRLEPADGLLIEFDRRVLDPELRMATRSRFVSEHYADAVEAGVKALNECVRSRSGRREDGDDLMTIAFSPKGGLLRINRGRSKSDASEQRGHMLLCQGVVAAWRNPRAHQLVDDSPAQALMMLEAIDDLIATTKSATRTRKRRSK